MGLISPELVLVDDTLAEAARRVLPSPGDCLAPCVRCAEPVADLPPRIDQGRPRRALPARAEPDGRSRPSLVLIVAALLVAGIVGSPAVDLVRRHPSNGPHLLGGPEATSAAGLRGSRATSDLSWQPVPGAVAYELVVRDGTRTVLQLRPVSTHVSLPLDTAGMALAAGLYAWSVAPLLHARGARVGPVSASGVLRITE